LEARDGWLDHAGKLSSGIDADGSAGYVKTDILSHMTGQPSPAQILDSKEPLKTLCFQELGKGFESITFRL